MTNIILLSSLFILGCFVWFVIFQYLKRPHHNYKLSQEEVIQTELVKLYDRIICLKPCYQKSAMETFHNVIALHESINALSNRTGKPITDTSSTTGSTAEFTSEMPPYPVVLTNGFQLFHGPKEG